MCQIQLNHNKDHTILHGNTDLIRCDIHKIKQNNKINLKPKT